LAMHSSEATQAAVSTGGDRTQMTTTGESTAVRDKQRCYPEFSGSSTTRTCSATVHEELTAKRTAAAMLRMRGAQAHPTPSTTRSLPLLVPRPTCAPPKIAYLLVFWPWQCACRCERKPQRCEAGRQAVECGCWASCIITVKVQQPSEVADLQR
jgi:hypothetical protein